jgi:hypothetical protein
MNALLERLRPRAEATAAGLKREANDYMQRAQTLERNQQYDEASVLYKRVISLIGSHEGTSAVNDELATIKRNANQHLMQTSLRQGRPRDSTGNYQNMVRQLSNHVPDQGTDDELKQMADEIFEDAAAFQPLAHGEQQQESNATVLFQVDEGARLFYMAKDGSIQTNSETLPLTVYEMRYGQEIG